MLACHSDDSRHSHITLHDMVDNISAANGIIDHLGVSVHSMLSLDWLYIVVLSMCILHESHSHLTHQ
jgi:hypothetical protein